MISSDVSLTANEEAVVNKYGFDVKTEAGLFLLTDPVVRKANRGKGGRHQGGDLNLLLTAAVKERQAHDDSVSKVPLPEKANGAAPTAYDKAQKREEHNVKSLEKALGVSASPTDVDPQPETKQPETAADVNDNTPETMPPAEEKPAEEPPKAKPEEKTSTPTKAGKGKAKAATPKAEPTPTKPDAPPPAELSDVELDETGKREKKSKKREKTPRKDNRYLRAAKIIAGRLDIDDKELSKQASMSAATAGHCLEAWKGITAVLIEKGWLKIPGEKKNA